MPLFKVVERISKHEDHIFFVQAPDQETACKRIGRAQATAVLTSAEVSVAAGGASPEERASYGHP